MKNLSTRELILASLSVTLLIVSSYISVPLPFTPIPGTIQTLMVVLVALAFSPKVSRISILVFILLGALGLPVFSGGRGGAAVLLGPTGGFIMGFVIAVFLISAFKSRFHSLPTTLAGAVILGNVPIYVLGAIYLSNSTGMALSKAILVGVIPFILPDIFKTVMAVMIYRRLRLTKSLKSVS